MKRYQTAVTMVAFALRASSKLLRTRSPRALSALAESLVDCSRVLVKPDPHGGAGAFAAVDIPAGGLVERGIVRRLTNVDGHENPFVFTWSDDTPNTTWATGSGASTFYNTPVDGGAAANTRMARDFGADSFEIFATRDIAAGDELLHEYKSKAWRACFSDLRS